MFDIILKQIVDAFGEQTAILIALSGYFLYILLFYTTQENSTVRLIWKDFQWGDRIMIGAIIGSLFWIFFIWPFTIFFDQVFSVVPRSIMQIYGFNNLFGIKQQILVTGILFIIILMIRKNTIILSNEGANKIVNLITLKLPIYFYGLILFFIFQVTSYALSYHFYSNYETIINFWLLNIFLHFFSIPFIFFGISLIYSILLFYGIEVNKNVYRYFQHFYAEMLRDKIGKVGKIQYWIVFSAIVSILISGSFIVLDSKYSIITPVYEVYKQYDHGYSYLNREPYVNSHYLTRSYVAKGRFTEPLLNHTRYIIIENPSNLKTNLHKVSCNEDFIDIKGIKDNAFLNIKTMRPFQKQDGYNITLHYKMKIDDDIQIYQSIGDRASIGNGAYYIEYNLTINNDTDELVATQNTFAALELHPTLLGNVTILYYENEVMKEYSIINYDIIDSWFFPDMYIKPKSITNMRFIISGTN